MKICEDSLQHCSPVGDPGSFPVTPTFNHEFTTFKADAVVTVLSPKEVIVLALGLVVYLLSCVEETEWVGQSGQRL